MPTVKHLSYAGITLPLAPSWLEEKFLTVIKDEPSFEVANYWNFDTPNAQSLPTPSIPKPPNWKLGVLNWPTGASRAAWFHTVVETDRLNRIKTAVGLTNTASPLVFYDGRAGKTITAQMRMLPERPLNVLGHDFSDLWLLTLTDQRFFWNWCRGNITQPVSWTELFSRLGTLLGVSITVEGIDARYGEPSAKWVLPYANTPVVLDAAATQVGQRVVVGLDGTVKTVNWETARAASDAYIASSSRVVAGGLTSEASIGRYVPASVDVLFLDATTTPASKVPAVTNRTLTSLAIPQYGAATGVVGFKQAVYADLVYDGTNGFDAVNYANAAAEDWYGWRLPDTDIVYPGVEPWVPTGWEDTCEWVLKLVDENPLTETPGADDPIALTRVRRGPWLDFSGGDWYGGLGPGQCGGGLESACATPVTSSGSGSGSGSGNCQFSNDGFPPDCTDPDGDDVLAVRDVLCIMGTLYVVRGRLGLVVAVGRARMSWYDLYVTEEGCCECGAGSGGNHERASLCCPDVTTMKTSLSFAVTGPFGLDCASVELTGSLVPAADGSYQGIGSPDPGDANADGVSGTFRLTCVNQVWQLDGVITLPDGSIVLVTWPNLNLDDPTIPFLVGSVDAPARINCPDATCDAVVEYPCGGGDLTCCPSTSKSLKFTAISTTGTCSCFLGATITIPWDPVGAHWASGAVAFHPCNYNITFEVTCSDGVPPFSITQSVLSWSVTGCSPWTAVVVTSENVVPPGLNCDGTVTWAVEEVTP